MSFSCICLFVLYVLVFVIFMTPPPRPAGGIERSESESELLLVTRPNGNHAPGSLTREVSP